MEQYSELHRTQEELHSKIDFFNRVSTEIDLTSAYKLAFEVQNPKIKRILRDLILLRKYKEAADAADRVRDDNALLI